MKKELFFTGLFLFFCFYAPAQKLQKLVPDYAKLQFAGGIGFVAVGAGYESKKGKTETDLYYGYVPPKIGGINIHSISGKFTWFPLKKWEQNKVEIKPLSFGVLANYTFGKQYFLFAPELYPYDYYGYPTALHFGAFLGGQISTPLKKSVFKRIGFYYELGTFDYEAGSYFTNTKALHISDIINIGIGIKTGF